MNKQDQSKTEGGGAVASSAFLDDVLNQISERERKILRMRFGVDGHIHTLADIGKQMKVTRERVRQIEAKALRKLRQPDRVELLNRFMAAESANTELCGVAAKPKETQ